VTVYDSRRDSGGCTRSPNVHAELSDATFTPGETFEDTRHGVTVTVAGADLEGDHRVRVTRR
ncbi:M6 family metalloprotease domain-containing protein, partial [Streptomyces sp. TRM76130]|nr:M6 family metalloprotease domain-containing protein [Streptomyces sp. TRM76130]